MMAPLAVAGPSRGFEKAAAAASDAATTTPEDPVAPAPLLWDDTSAEEREKQEGFGLEPPVPLRDDADSASSATAQDRLASRFEGIWAYLYPLSAKGGAGGESASAPRLEALDAPRWIASIQIVFYHMHQWSGAKFTWRGIVWGSAWTQFFFMLSAFVLAYSEMARPPRKNGNVSLLQYVRKRLVVIYPSYVLSLVMCIVDPRTKTPFEWSVLPLHLLLLQAWFPICHNYREWGFVQCSAWAWNGEAWFLSVLFFYWLFLRPLANAFRHKSLAFCYIVIAVCWIWSWVPAEIMTWPKKCNMVIAIAVRASPFGYFHVFVSGVSCARVFILTSMRDAETDELPSPETRRLKLDVARSPFALAYGCFFGYALYATVYCFVPLHSKEGWLKRAPDLARNGGLIPIMMLVLLGAAIGVDPITRWIFRLKPLLVLGRISYLQYLFQKIVWNVVKHLNRDLPVTKTTFFICVLIGWAYVVQRWFEYPFTEYQLQRQKSDKKGIDQRVIERLDRWFDANCFSMCSVVILFVQVTVTAIAIHIQEGE